MTVIRNCVGGARVELAVVLWIDRIMIVASVPPSPIGGTRPPQYALLEKGYIKKSHTRTLL